MRIAVASDRPRRGRRAAGRGRRLARVARPEPRRRLRRDGPAEPLVARGRRPRLEGAFRLALDAGRLRQPPLPVERERRHRQGAREGAGAPALPRRRHRPGDLGEALQRLPHGRARAPRRLGLAERRPRDRERLRLRRRRPPARARRDGQAAVAAPAHRGVRRDLDARRPDRVAGDRGRPRDREHAQLRLGRPGARHQPLLRLRQGERRRPSGSARRSRSTTTPTTRRPRC